MNDDALTSALVATLSQIQQVLTILRTPPIPAHSNVYVENDIGLHVRHVMDHVQAFLAGVQSGEVDYNVRYRNSLCETDPDIASTQLDAIMDMIQGTKVVAGTLSVVSEVDCVATRSERFESNAAREVLYLINHTIHHAAYIRLLLRNSGIVLPEHIGVAPSTATFRREMRAELASAH